MLNVLITPTPALVRDDNGIGRIVHAQYAHLPRYGIQLVDRPEQADVIACHIEGRDLPRIDCLHLHGLYFSDIPHEKYMGWHHEANRRVAASARRAHTITVPSPWVGHAFARDMRINPVVIPHGLDLSQWELAEHKGYTLFNKNRPSDVCSVTPVIALADAGVSVVSTFGPDKHPHLIVTGTQPHERMRELIRHAAVYLATTPETFGIGTLEAMACGVPILGYDWCGTADLVQHQVNGYLVTPGDTEGLRRGHAYVMEHRERLGAAARQTAQRYGWDALMQRYADLYYATADAIRSETHRVSVVITNHNYASFLEEAIGCVLSADEVIVVDDGSTDNSLEVTELYRPHSHVKVITQSNQGVAAARNNGIAATTGDYIVCLDADDTLDARYIQVCRDALKADRGLGIAYTGLGLIQENGAISPAAFPPEFDWAIQAQPTNPPATCVPTAAMFRRAMWERAGGYVQLYAPGEDAEFYTRGLSIGYTARKVDMESLIHYRAHAGSASRTKQYRPIDMWHPWMRDGMVPFAAPTSKTIPVRSYALPLVSVIIPVGSGHARYLPAALDSLLGQTFRNWEAIVIDDSGGGGGDWDRIKHIYPFIRLWETQNLDGDGSAMGAGFARNVGIEHARAPLVLFLDADDWLHPLALQQMLMAYAQHGKYVYTDWVAVKDGAAEPRPSRDYDPLLWLPDSGTSSGLHSVTVLMETAHARAVGGFDEALVSWEDWDFFCKLAMHGYCGQRLPEPLLFYRVHGGTRRELAHVAPGLRDTIRKRYAAIRDGKEPLMACCGNNSPLMGQVAGAMMGDAYQGGDIPDGKVLVRYTGTQRGEVTYSGSQLRGKYRVSADAPLFLAMKEDAEWFKYQAYFSLEEPSAPVIAVTSDPVLAILGTQSVQAQIAKHSSNAPIQAVQPTEGADTFPVIPPDQVQALQARAQRRGG